MSFTLLSIAPYRILPPATGGQLAIAMLHHYFGEICVDHLVSTDDNPRSPGWNFALHPLFPSRVLRYLPFAHVSALEELGRTAGVGAVWCEHPYMAPTASRVAKRLGVHWYLRAHNIEGNRFRELGKRWWPILARFEAWAVRAASGTFFITPEDADWAVQHYGLPRQKAHVAPFGTPLKSAPVVDAGAKQRVAAELGLDADKVWYYFLGAMGYQPNADAARHILDEVLPRLGEEAIVLIAGKGLPENLQKRVLDTGGRARYLGFLPELHDFLLAQDVMLNAVLSGGGIKTKAVEALAYGKPVVSTTSGAAGLMREACGNALYVLPDGDWASFAAAAKEAAKKKPTVSSAFYREYFWGSVAENVLQTLQAGKK